MGKRAWGGEGGPEAALSAFNSAGGRGPEWKPDPQLSGGRGGRLQLSCQPAHQRERGSLLTPRFSPRPPAQAQHPWAPPWRRGGHDPLRPTPAVLRGPGQSPFF